MNKTFFQNWGSLVYWFLTLIAFAVGVWLVFAVVPTEETMGPIQKIFYLHLPIAFNAFLVCTVTFVCSVGYLWKKQGYWDDLAVASARVAVLLCSIVLLTGMIWGHSAWGVWWTWSPRLTFSLVLWLLYVVYLVIRPSIEEKGRRSLVCAVYGIVAYLDVPLVYLSVRLMPDIHPRSIELAPEMTWVLLYWMLPVVMMTVGLLCEGYSVQRRVSEQQNQTQYATRQTATSIHPTGELT